MVTEIFKIEEEITEKMKPPKWAEFTSYNMDSFDVPLNFHDLQLKQTLLQITLFLTHPVHIYNIYSDIYTAGPPDLDDVGYRTVLAFSNPGYSQRVAHIRSVEWDNI